MILTEKLHRIIFLFIFSLISFVAFSQTSVLDKKISIQFSRKPLGFVLKSIEKQADVNFVYVSGLFNQNRVISISVKNTPLRIITRKLIQDKTIDFQARGKNIVLSRKEKTSGDKDISIDKVSIKKKLQQIEALKKTDVTPISVVSTHPIITKDTIAPTKTDTLVTPMLKKEQRDTNATSIKNTTRTPSVGEWLIGVYGGYNFISEELSQNKAQYVLFKEVKDAEAIKSVFCGGISFEYKKGNWGIQTGLGIMSKRWSVKYNYRVIRPNLSEIEGYQESTSWIVNEKENNTEDNSSSDSTMVITRTPIYKSDTVNVNYSNVNTASYLVVPLQLNHYYPISTHFAMQLGFGAELMLLYSSQGMVKVSKNSELEDIDKYLNDCYFRIKAVFGLNYLLTKKNIMSLQTSYGVNATSVFKSVYPIDRSETAISLTLSYIRRF